MGTKSRDAHSFFEKFGPVIYVKFSLSQEDGYESRGYGWVQFGNTDAAKRCQEANATDLHFNDHAITVDTTKPRNYDEPAFHRNNIYMQNFADNEKTVFAD